MLRILPSCSQQVLDSGHKTQAAQQLSLKIHIIVIYTEFRMFNASIRATQQG